MKYEATLHFELTDERVDLTDLMTDQMIDIDGVGWSAARKKEKSRRRCR